jgi:hypothetical protein
MSSTRYTFELWTKDGNRIADITALCHSRSYTITRNDAEDFSFDIDLFALEAYCASINENPLTFITPYETNVRIKRGDDYVLGGEVVDAPLQLGTDQTMSQGQGSSGAQTFNPTITVTGKGYLNLFKARYVTNTYNGNERCFIARDLIARTQAVPNGDVGVTMGPQQYDTGIEDTERSYSQQNVATGIQNLTTLQDGTFDFAFGADKVFSTYQMIGSPRTDLQLRWGDDQGNFSGMYLDRTATSLYNEVIGVGDGFGADALTTTQDDIESQRNYYLRQDIKQYNGVTEQPTLDGNAARDLALEKGLLQIPQITITSKELEGIPFLGIGDQIPLRFVNHPYLNPLSGTYRSDKMVVDIDDNDFETITLYFDNYTLLG